MKSWLYRKDRLNYMVFLSLSNIVKWYILFRWGNAEHKVCKKVGKQFGIRYNKLNNHLASVRTPLISIPVANTISWFFGHRRLLFYLNFHGLTMSMWFNVHTNVDYLIELVITKLLDLTVFQRNNSSVHIPF